MQDSFDFNDNYSDVLFEIYNKLSIEQITRLMRIYKRIPIWETNSCCQIVDKLEKIITIVPRTSLPAAAGGDELSDIPEYLLENSDLPADIKIMCEREEKGYSLRIESDIPMELTIVFMQNEKELYRQKISPLIPNEEDLIPTYMIKGWTHIKILKSPSG